MNQIVQLLLAWVHELRLRFTVDGQFPAQPRLNDELIHDDLESTVDDFLYEHNRSAGAPRDKWLSKRSPEVVFTGESLSTTTYMDYNGIACSATFGYHVEFDSTIVSIRALEDAAATGTVTYEIHQNGSNVLQTTIVNPASSSINDAADIDVDAGDVIAGYFLSGTAGAKQLLSIRLRRRQ